MPAKTISNSGLSSCQRVGRDTNRDTVAKDQDSEYFVKLHREQPILRHQANSGVLASAALGLTDTGCADALRLCPAKKALIR